MRCVAAADDSTPVRIEWMKDDRAITYNEVVKQNDEGHLELNVRRANDKEVFAAKYTCIASNGYDTRYASAVIEKPKEGAS